MHRTGTRIRLPLIVIVESCYSASSKRTHEQIMITVMDHQHGVGKVIVIDIGVVKVHQFSSLAKLREHC